MVSKHLSIVLPLLAIGTLLVNAAQVRQASSNSNRAGSRTSELKNIKAGVELSAVDTKPKTAIGNKTKSLFQQNCAKCHGRDGKGQTAKGQIAGAPDFTDPKWQELSEAQELANSIQHGRGQMPSFGGKLSSEQIKTLAAYVRTFKK